MSLARDARPVTLTAEHALAVAHAATRLDVADPIDRHARRLLAEVVDRYAAGAIPAVGAEPEGDAR